jgi:Bifunctional DNA primase/polymerase, N-terminal
MGTEQVQRAALLDLRGRGRIISEGVWCAMTAPKSAGSLADAIILASEGLHCFPCAASKRPATPHGFLDASADPAVLQELWARYPGPLVGVRTGSTSRIDVLDLDRKHREAMEWWSSYRDRLPLTRVHRTRSGGLHLVFQHAPDIRCSASRIAPGVDVRGDGGYVIWWPTTGLPVLSDARIASWPDWLLAQLLPSKRTVAPRVTVPDSHAMMHLVQLIAGANAGERNNFTFWAACRAGEMVASGLLGADAAVAVIAEAATRAGLPRSEAERTAWSGIRATGGLAHA